MREMLLFSLSALPLSVWEWAGLQIPWPTITINTQDNGVQRTYNQTQREALQQGELADHMEKIYR